MARSLTCLLVLSNHICQERLLSRKVPDRKDTCQVLQVHLQDLVARGAHDEAAACGSNGDVQRLNVLGKEEWDLVLYSKQILP